MSTGKDVTVALQCPQRQLQTHHRCLGGKLDPSLEANIYNGELRNYGNVNNNILSFFRTGITTTNAVAFNKTNDNSSFRVSISDMRNWDIVPESDLNRTSVSFKGSAKMTKRLTVEAQGTYSYETVKNRPALSDSPSNIGNALIGIAPNFDQKWLAANYKDEAGRYNDWNGDKYRINPYWVINEMSNKSKRDRLMGQGRVYYSFMDCLQASFKAGLDSYTFRFTDFTPMYTPGFVDGLMKEMTNNVMQYNFEMMLRFQKRFNDFDISAFAGGNVMRYEYESMIQTGQSQVIPDLQDITNYSSIETEHALVRKAVRSLFGQVSLGYKELLYIDATFRNDVSSTLSASNRSYFYPSVSGSLIFSNLFEHKDWLTFGKLRGSWAKVGGDTSPYQLQLEYGLKAYTNKGTSLGYIASGSVPNANLKPTSTYSFEVGLDVRFFDSRLGLDLTYYQQTTKDQILSLPLSQSTGYKRAVINAGEIANKGIEAFSHSSR
ncbi:TonB-dependent receptor [Bacteroides sp. CR5/BHMF/2]|nr:TonB-dependent receptor [Bacteroides sp. CR5/BHMF/2]